MSHPPVPSLRTLLMAAVAMLAFAGNSLLCRMALASGAIEAVPFTLVRLGSGALVLALLVARRESGWAVPAREGDWPSALALWGYAAAFSWAYVQLSAAAGALLLFGTVQLTMVGYGLWRGERLGRWQWLGLLGACGGLALLLMPGVQAPPLGGALLMVVAGVAWGLYSLRGRGQGDPTRVTAGNFWRAALLALAVAVVQTVWVGQGLALTMTAPGLAYALASGALASGLGYAVWYRALRGLTPATAASVQLTVPVLAALGALLFLAEPLSARLVLVAPVILGGVALVLFAKPGKR